MVETTSTVGRRLVAALLLVLGALVLSAPPAGSHTEASPRRLTPGTQARIVVTATPERAPYRNERLTMIVPRQFEPLTCSGPDGWVCGLDRQTHAPHVLVEWESVGTAADDALDFSVNVLVPTEAGAYLLRALQTHADGYVEPWVYNEEPFPSALVIVGDDTTLVNPDGSAEDPPCYGPSYQPTYEEHDGSAVEPGCDPNEPAPDPRDRPNPAPEPEPEPTTGESTPTSTPTTRPAAEPTSQASATDPTEAASPEPSSEPSSMEPSDAPATNAPGRGGVPRPSATARPPSISVEDLDRPRDSQRTKSPVLLVGGLAVLTVIGVLGRRELRRTR